MKQENQPHDLKKMCAYTKKAIDCSGGPAALARIIKSQGGEITTQAISQWHKVPDKRVILVEKAAKQKVTRYQLRPDIFGTHA